MIRNILIFIALSGFFTIPARAVPATGEADSTRVKTEADSLFYVAMAGLSEDDIGQSVKAFKRVLRADRGTAVFGNRYAEFAPAGGKGGARGHSAGFRQRRLPDAFGRCDAVSRVPR